MRTTIQIQTFEEKNTALKDYWQIIAGNNALARISIVASILVFYAALTVLVSLT